MFFRVYLQQKSRYGVAGFSVQGLTGNEILVEVGASVSRQAWSSPLPGSLAVDRIFTQTVLECFSMSLLARIEALFSVPRAWSFLLHGF